MYISIAMLAISSAVVLSADITGRYIQPHDSIPAPVEFELVRSRIPPPHPPAQTSGLNYGISIENPYQKRDSINIPAYNEESYYMAQLLVGTPPQNLSFIIDTGSSDLWVRSATSNYCIQIGCRDDDFFNETASSTFKHIEPTIPFKIGYAGGNGASGYMVLDTVRIGAATLTNAEFAVVTSESNISPAIWGIGFSTEPGALVGSHLPYQNLPAKLASEGIINTNAYSLWLNDPDSESGRLLFGGVDHAKYFGTLGVMPMYNYFANRISRPNQLRVMLNSISSVNNDDECLLATFDIAVLLDSGTTFALLPPQIVDQMATAINYTHYDSNMKYYVGNCDETGVQAFDLDFSGKKIRVPATQLLSQYGFSNGKPQCILAINATSTSYQFVLGGIFLQSMYVVFDLKNYEIAIAQAIQNTQDSNIEQIVDKIPSATSVSGYFSNTTNNNIFSTYHVESCIRKAATTSSTFNSKSVSSITFSEDINPASSFNSGPTITTSKINPTVMSDFDPFDITLDMASTTAPVLEFFR